MDTATLKTEFKPIIKNIGRYENIKLATGVILDKSPKKFRSEYNTTNFVGISTKTYGNYWFKVNGKDAIFKSFDAQKITKPARIVNELLCMELCKQIGLDCATCEPATINGTNGIISYNVAKGNEQLKSAAEIKYSAYSKDRKNSLYDYYHVLKILKNSGYNINISKSLTHLYKLAIFDFLTMQTDRHAGNVFFLFNKGMYQLKPAPVFDNEFSFLANALPAMNLFYENVDFDLIKSLYNKVDIVFSVKPYNKSDKKKYDVIKKDIIDFANKTPNAKLILSNTINNFNIKKAIRNVEKMGVKIPLSYKNYVTMITESIKKDLLNDLNANKNCETIAK